MRSYNLKTSSNLVLEIQSDLQRKIKIMHYISNEKRWYTFEEISQYISVCTKTISKDIAIIKDFIPENWDIKIKRGFGVQLLMPINSSIEEITCIFFKNSLTFEVLDRLLNQKETSVANLANELHIQPYIITKLLKKIEKDLVYYNLRLQRKPLEIKGEEWDIIWMFTDFYLKAYSILDWPFQINKDYILNFIDMLEKSICVVLNLGSRRYLSFFMGILLIRKRQGIKIDCLGHIFGLNVDTPHFNQMSIQIDEWSRKYGISFSYSEKLLISTTFKCKDYTYEEPIRQKKLDIQIFNERKIEIYNIVRNFIDMLYKKFGYQFIKGEEFIHSLIIHFRKRIYLLHCYPYIKYIEMPSIEYLKRKHFKTFLKVKDVYDKWIIQYKIASYVPEEEIMSIVLYIEAALICENIIPKKIIIITRQGDCWKKYIKAILKKRFGNKIDFPINNSSNIEKGLELESKYNVDLIVSTMPLDVTHHPVVQIQPTVSERDLYNLAYYIN
ncbi:helix-turn-helix domain-containing protein [Bacillus cereus]|nr:helix-turn-helix domain-containing protein [Bacillus cereus]